MQHNNNNRDHSAIGSLKSLAWTLRTSLAFILRTVQYSVCTVYTVQPTVYTTSIGNWLKGKQSEYFLHTLNPSFSLGWNDFKEKNIGDGCKNER